MKNRNLFLTINFYTILAITFCSNSNPTSKNESVPEEKSFSPDSEWLSSLLVKPLERELIESTAKYTVEDGKIIGVTVHKNQNKILCTKENYSNFILELEVKIDAAFNSSIRIRRQC